ncbi:MAG: hypothetical protein ABIC57_00710 [bacterium]
MAKSKSKMLPKIDPQDPHRTDFLSGTFVIAGLTIVALVILIFTISKIPYRVDPELSIPTLDSIDSHTNEETIVLTGDGEPGENIALYINDRLQTQISTVDEYGTFEFPEIPLSNEGEYKFEVATVSGSILKKRSELSNSAVSVVDRTAPSKDVSIVFPENTDMDEAIISGTAEINTYVILEKGVDEYQTKSNSEGFFQFDNIPLEKGDNTFYVGLKDEAGNEVLSSNQAKILFTPGEVNGDGVYSDLPESAGEIEKAIDTIMSQNIMFIFGLAAFIVLIFSSAILYKQKLQKK